MFTFEKKALSKARSGRFSKKFKHKSSNSIDFIEFYFIFAQ